MNTSRLASKAAVVLGRSSARNMSSTAKVWIDKNTRVICQGFTGKQVGWDGFRRVYNRSQTILTHTHVCRLSLFFFVCLSFVLLLL